MAEPSRPAYALVTGASSGIGAAFARALSGRGRRVVLVARRLERLAAMAGELGGEEAAVALPCDLAAPDGVGRLLGALEERRIEVDLLISNAGLGHTGRFWEEPADRLVEMVDVNVRALVALTRALLAPMVARRRGQIVNVVSTAAFQPIPYMSVYAASKVFVLSFTDALGDELKGSGVEVQALCPGLTATEFQAVAGTDGLRFNRTRSMTPEAVVEASLRALERGKRRVIPGWQNRAVAAAAQWLPRAWVRGVAGSLFRPRQTTERS